MQTIQFDPKIDLGTIITLISIVIGAIVTITKLFAKVDRSHSVVETLVADFRDHVKEDREQFDNIRESLFRIKVGDRK